MRHWFRLLLLLLLLMLKQHGCSVSLLDKHEHLADMPTRRMNGGTVETAIAILNRVSLYGTDSHG